MMVEQRLTVVADTYYVLYKAETMSSAAGAIFGKQLFDDQASDRKCKREKVQTNS